MAGEAWTLAGVALTSGNFDILELANDPPKARLEWITVADSEGAALMRDPEHENRTITMKLRVAAQASMNAALDQVGAIRDKLRLASLTSDGIALTWTPANSTRTVTFDVLAGEIPEMPIGLDGHAWSWFKQRPIFTIEMTCKPYWRGVETTTSTASSSTPFVTLEVTGVTGDVPALGRLIVTDTATQSRRHAEWGLESQFYNSGTSLLVDSDSMTVGAGYVGAQTTRTGAYDPNATGNNVIRGTLYSSSAAVCSTGALSHVGTFRVKARVWATSPDVRLRLVWQEGDGVWSANPYTPPNVFAGFSEIDLGLITVNTAASGTQRWVGKIEAYSLTAADTLDIDYLILVPAAEGYGKARAAYNYARGQLAAVDDFQSAVPPAALNTRAAQIGGSWATSGATTDYVAEDWAGSGDIVMLRNTTADTGNIGRAAVLGSTSYTDSEAHVQFTANYSSPDVGTTTGVYLGVLLRYVDASNYLWGYVSWTTVPRLNVVQTVATVNTVLVSIPISPLARLRPYLVRLIAWANGTGQIRLEDPNGPILNSANFSSAALATAGALQTGKPGFFDNTSTSPLTITRRYMLFAFYVPVLEPIVVYSGRTIEVRYNDTLRQDSGGTIYGRPPTYRGTRFLVPPGTSRVLAKMRRNDIEVAADDQVTDATQMQIAWTPRGLVVPR